MDAVGTCLKSVKLMSGPTLGAMPEMLSEPLKKENA